MIDTKEAQTVENQHYTVPIENLTQKIQSLNIPKGAIIEFSYKLKTPEQKKITKNKKRKLPPEVLKLKKNLKKIGNISDEGQKTFEENTKIFRETFDI